MAAPATLKTAIAIRHVHFEDLGILEPILIAAGYRVHYYDLDLHQLWTLDPLLADLLIVLGGPIGANDGDAYPFLVEELQILEARMAAGRPTMGICLGAQLMARALGAAVKSTGKTEIGFAALALTDAGRAGPLRHLQDVPVLHWHGDTFAIPAGAAHLASTPLCANQAFAVGRNILGVQFHPEVDASAGVERWLVGHALELASNGIDPRRLRADAADVGPRLRRAAREMFTDWLQGLAE